MSEPAFTPAFIDEQLESVLRAAGHKVQCCDATTGHFVHNVAYCDTPERARELVTAVNTQPAVADLVKALRGMFCPRPCNGRPHDFDVGDCYDAGECGCIAGDALSRFRELEKAND